MVSKLAAEHVKVVLSGDGGDELFAGYDRYAVEAQRRAFPLASPVRRSLAALAALLPSGARGRNFLRNRGLDFPERYLDASTLFRREEMRHLFMPDAFRRLAGEDPWAEARRHLSEAGGHWLSAVRTMDLKSYLPLDILTKVDRMSMAHSLEAREPMLDHRLVEFAATIPPELLLRNGATKWLLKESLRGILPQAIVDGRKQGFAVPLARWFRGSLSGFLRDLLLAKRSRERGIFDPAAVERLLRRHEEGRDLDLQLWTLLSFELWCRRFVDARPARLREAACASA
jgi:asparagine synthase (glutamine-hydrolysing)